MWLDILWYALPFIPIILRSVILMVRFSALMKERLSPEALASDFQRTLLIPLMSLSFQALVAVAVVDVAARGRFNLPKLDLPIYYLLISFLAYFFNYNFQSYKGLRWHQYIVGDSFRDIGNYSLMLSVIAIVLNPEPRSDFAYWFAAIAAAGLLIDFAIHTMLTMQYLSKARTARSAKVHSHSS